MGTISSPKGCGALEQAAQGSAGVTIPEGLDSHRDEVQECGLVPESA